MFYIKKNNNNETNLFDEMSSLFNNTFNRNYGLRTDIIDNNHEYLVQMDVPGINKDNIKIDIEDDYLNVMITKGEKKEDANGTYLRNERRVESMSRSFYIGEVEKENVKAKIVDGVLNIIIPKAIPKVEEKKYIDIE